MRLAPTIGSHVWPLGRSARRGKWSAGLDLCLAMDVVVSPYHLTSREPAAMVSLLLADRVVTLMPAPTRTMRADDLRDAALALPRYLKFVESWRWSQALWECGAIVSQRGGLDPIDEVRRVWEDLAAGAWPELSLLMRDGLFDDERGYLDAVAGDVLKGGPDPGICIPVSAGLDRFAAGCGLLSARSAAVSVAQKAEERMGRRLFAFSVPVLSQTPGELMSDVRADAEEMLGELRESIDAACEQGCAADGGAGDGADGGASGVECSRRVSEASRRVSGSLADLLACAVEASDRRETRTVLATATVTGVALPVNAVLASSSLAASALIGTRSSRGDEPQATLPVADPLAGRMVAGLVVKLVGSPGAGGRR